MRTIASILFLAVVALLAEMVLPWYTIAVVGFLFGGLLRMPPGRSFMVGFTGLFIGWGVVMMLRDSANGHILSTRVAGLFHLPGHFTLIIVIAILGGLISGLAAMSGSLLLGRGVK